MPKLAYFSNNEHGGACCGVSHMYNFPFNHIDSNWRQTNYTEDEKIKSLLIGLLEFYPEVDGCDCDDCRGEENSDFHHCVEVVITEAQRKVWHDALINVGFVETFSFHNTNSGNRCFFYHIETNKSIFERARA